MNANNFHRMPAWQNIVESHHLTAATCNRQTASVRDVHPVSHLCKVIVVVRDNLEQVPRPTCRATRYRGESINLRHLGTPFIGQQDAIKKELTDINGCERPYFKGVSDAQNSGFHPTDGPHGL